MRKFKKKNTIKKYRIYLLLILSIIVMGVGYSVLSTDLNINGIMTLFRYGKPYIERDSWAEMIENIQNGETDKYKVGEEKEVDMGALGKHKLRIVNNSSPTECNTLSSQTACGFVMEFVDFVDRKPMNTTNTNDGGYPASSLYQYINKDIYDALPAIIRNSIISTTTVSGLKSGTTTTEEKLYLFTANELLNANHNNDNVKLGTHTRQLDYYNSIGVTSSNTSGAIKMPSEAVKAYWLRSAQNGSSTNFRNIGSTGAHNGSAATNSTYGVSPAFRLSDLKNSGYKIIYDLGGGEEGLYAPNIAIGDSTIQVSKPKKAQFTVNIDPNSQGATILDANGRNVTKSYNSQIFSGWTASNINTTTAKYGDSASTVSTSWSNSSTVVGNNTDSVFFKSLGREGDTVTLQATWTPHDNIEPITLPTAEKIGHVCYFNTKSDGSGTNYENGSVYTPSTLEGSTILYVTCHERHTVNLDNQGATIAGTEQVTAEVGNAMPTITVPQKEFGVTFDYNGGEESTLFDTAKYTFDGYYEAENAHGRKYYNADGTSAHNWDKSENATIYANWTGSGEVTLPSSSNGGKILEWYTETSGGTFLGGPGDKFIPSETLTIHAQWSDPVTSTITFNKQGGSGGTNSISATTGQNMPSIAIPSTAPTTNYIVTLNKNDGSENIDTTLDTVFNGYYDEENGTGTKYYNANGSSARKWNKKQDTTLYADWAGVLPYPTSSNECGYNFKGWYTESSGGVRVGGEGDIYYPTSTTTLYAQWSVNSLQEDTWETIISNVESGNTSHYNIGLTKRIELGNNLGTHCIRVANTSTPSECSATGFSETACGFVLEFADIITTHNMNSTNVGGWPASEMRTYLNSTSNTTSIYNSLPTVIKDAIINTTVVSGHGSTLGEANFSSTDKLYLLSTHEVWEDVDGNTSSGIDRNDTGYNNTRQLDYYANLEVTTSNYSSAIKKWINSGNTSTWWLRSAYSSTTNRFFSVFSEGTSNHSTANITRGVAPAFRLGATYKIAYQLNGGEKGISSPTNSELDKIVEVSKPKKAQYTVNIDSNSQGAIIEDTNGNSVISTYNSQIFDGWTATNINTTTAKYGNSQSTVTNSWTNPNTKIGAGQDTIYFKNLANLKDTVTLEAHWLENSTIENITLPTITKPGYTCGYAESASGTIVYNSGASYTPSTTTGSTTLYAKCVLEDPQTPTVSGGTTKIYGSSNTTLRCQTTTYASGTTAYYSFGYATVDGGTPSNWTEVTTTSTLTIDKSEYVGDRYYSCRVYATNGVETTNTVTAQETSLMRINQAMITFDATTNGGTLNGNSVLYAKSGESTLFTTIQGSTVGIIPSVTPLETFEGWYSAANGGNKVLNADGTFSGTAVAGYTTTNAWAATSNKVLYARYKEVKAINISFDNTSVDADCTDAQCMLDCISNKVKYGPSYECPLSSSRFANDSWETIISNVQSGKTYEVGSTKEVALGNNLGTHTLRVANISTPSECSTTGFSQTACGFVLEFADIITTRVMNSSNTNVGGWPASKMRTYLNSTSDTTSIYNSLPTVIKDAIINTTVVSGHGSTSGEANFTSTDKLYLLSLREVLNYTGGYDTAQANIRQLDYYANQGVTASNYAGAIKQRNGSDYIWWLRLANSGSTDGFFIVYSSGGLSSSVASDANGVAPAFRIA